ncbi:MAG TPA: restriction endonuclease, SacI family [Terriglobia bacterium]|nr:restriction endonuclease, SacI family [Terriglobia bacterium]
MKRAREGELRDWLSQLSLVRDIHSSINSKTKTYRYVLPTQLSAKLADSSIDCRSVQVARGGKGAFDARSVAHRVIVPFDQANDNVLGGSQEPYVSKPLRFPEITRKYRGPQKNREGWDCLCRVLDSIEREQRPEFTASVFNQVLTEVYRRLALVHVVYPTPRRVSLDRTMKLIDAFLADHSGGDRLLALTCSLFVIIGRRFRLYATVRRAKITAADQASGMLADLECVSKGGEVVMAAEVKDRQITVSQMRAKMTTIRERQVSEIFFVAQGTSKSEESDVQRLIESEFVSGYSLYVTDLPSLARVALSLVGESGRREFLKETASQMEEYRSDVVHRRAWASLLGSA